MTYFLCVIGSFYSNNSNIHLIIQDTFIYVMKYRWNVSFCFGVIYSNYLMKIGI